MQLSVEASIEIDASPARVWQVLTDPEYTRQWSGAFGADGPIESTWQPGSPVLWRNASGEVYVKGDVVAVDPGRFLHFSVCDVGPDLQPLSGLPEDEITQTYSLVGDSNRTILSTVHGDFSKLPNGEEIHPHVEVLWASLLPRIKRIAEQAEMAEPAPVTSPPGPTPRVESPGITARPVPAWATALSIFCALTVVVLVYRDLFVPSVRDTEVWLGFEVHGWAARLTAPLHWAIFGLGAWGFRKMRSWIWPWASVYAFYVALSHLIWNLTSPVGGGWASGLAQGGLLAIPAIALLWARPRNPWTGAHHVC